MVGQQSNASKDSVEWKRGIITLKSGEKKKGKLVFHHEVLIKNQGLTWTQGVRYNKRSYASYHVVANAQVWFHDGTSAKMYCANDLKGLQFAPRRQSPDSLAEYATLPMPAPRINNTKYFFEIIANGRYSLFKRKSLICTNELNSEELVRQFSSLLNRKDVIVAYNYYVLDSDTNKFFLLKTERNALLKLMKNKRELVKRFIKLQSINLEIDADLERLFNHYNFLHSHTD